jgi:hypothetical protein
LWSPDGKELFYIPGPRQLASVRVTTQPGFTAGTVNRQSIESRDSPFEAPLYERNYDIAPDGRRFVRVVDAVNPLPSAPATRAALQVVLNCFEEVKRRAPGNSWHRRTPPTRQRRRGSAVFPAAQPRPHL